MVSCCTIAAPLFTLDPHSPNVIEPHKRPFNTLSAGFVMQSGKPLMTVTLMGGDMQAQGHAQMLVDVLDLGANMQAAADMARFRHSQMANVLSLETPLYDLVGAKLAAMGHTREIPSAARKWAACKSSCWSAPGWRRAPTGYYRGGSDFRKDGAAVAW